MQPYEVIKAKTQEEAIQLSCFKIGMLVEVVKVEAVSNSDGTFSVFPIVGVVEEDGPKFVVRVPQQKSE